LPQLAFIRNKEHWGAAFRFGVVRVSRDDFAAIARAWGASRGRFRLGLGRSAAPARPDCDDARYNRGPSHPARRAELPNASHPSATAAQSHS
jgi:hypothetical protein